MIGTVSTPFISSLWKIAFISRMSFGYVEPTWSVLCWWPRWRQGLRIGSELPLKLAAQSLVERTEGTVTSRIWAGVVRFTSLYLLKVPIWAWETCTSHRVTAKSRFVEPSRWADGLNSSKPPLVHVVCFLRTFFHHPPWHSILCSRFPNIYCSFQFHISGSYTFLHRRCSDLIALLAHGWVPGKTDKLVKNPASHHLHFMMKVIVRYCERQIISTLNHCIGRALTYN